MIIQFVTERETQTLDELVESCIETAQDGIKCPTKNNERAEVRIMAEIKLVRVDYRLIHGQVVARWLKVCPVRRIVLVDDVLGSDEFMSDIYKMAVPKGTDVDIVNH